MSGLGVSVGWRETWDRRWGLKHNGNLSCAKWTFSVAYMRGNHTQTLLWGRHEWPRKCWYPASQDGLVSLTQQLDPTKINIWKAKQVYCFTEETKHFLLWCHNGAAGWQRSWKVSARQHYHARLRSLGLSIHWDFFWLYIVRCLNCNIVWSVCSTILFKCSTCSVFISKRVYV